MSSRSTLTKQSVSAVKWSTLGNVTNYGLQLGAQIILARFLGPENYGLFALGRLVLTFTNMISNFGLAWGLVQAQNLNDEDVRFVFTWQLISGAVAATGLYLTAPLIANFFNEPRIEAIVQWLSLACLITSVTAPASNLLKRKLDFKSINIIEVTSYLVGYIVIGIPLAIYGAGVWTLVVAWLAQALCALLFSVIRCPHPIKPLLWYEGASTMAGIGYTVFATNLCNWLLNNLDRTLLGRFLNAQTVGLYTVGYNLANTPNSLFIGALQPAFLAAGARIQSEPSRLRSAYLSVLASVWILILPIFVILAFIAQDLVGFLYGPAWVSSGMVLTILALSIPAYITWGLSTPILWNTGRKHWESLLQLPVLILAGFAFLNLASKGVVMVAIVASCTMLARAIVITSAACHRLNIFPRDLLGFAVRGIVMASLAATATFVGAELGRTLWVAMPSLTAVADVFVGFDVSRITWGSHLYALLGGTFFGGSVLVTTSLVYPRILGAPVIQMLGRFSPPLFALLDRRLRYASTSYALFVGVIFGISILIATPLIYPQFLGKSMIEMVGHFSSTLSTVLERQLQPTSTKSGKGNE